MADEKNQLIGQLARARAGLAESAGDLLRDVDMSAKLRRSYRNNKLPWIGGAAALGSMLAMLSARKKNEFVKKNAGKKTNTEHKIREAAGAGVFLVLLKFALSALRPAVTSFVAKNVLEWI